MDRMTSMSTFVKVVDAGGFAAAGRALKMSPSTVTAHIQSLEDRLGARLLNRSTRSVVPTEAGQRLGIGKAWASRLHAKALGRLGRQGESAQSTCRAPLVTNSHKRARRLRSRIVRGEKRFAESSKTARIRRALRWRVELRGLTRFRRERVKREAVHSSAMHSRAVRCAYEKTPIAALPGS